MEPIIVKKTELIAALEKNRSTHRKIFEEALEGFRAMVLQRLEEMITNAKNNKKIEMVINLPKPEDHTKEYDRAIAMLQMDTQDTVKLNERDFQALVQDDWGWSRGFISSNSYYSSTARTMSESSGWGEEDYRA